jgi:CheY-like chemotaxis protein
MTAPIDVLVVDDDPNDRSLVLRALRRLPVPVVAMELEDGEAAIDYLRRQGPYRNLAGTPLPRLVLCDLKMPFHDGIDVLHAARQNPEKPDIPFVILSSSAHPRDLEAAEKGGANGYVIKPSTYAEFLPCVQSTVEKWLGLWKKELAVEPVATGLCSASIRGQQGYLQGLCTSFGRTCTTSSVLRARIPGL